MEKSLYEALLTRHAETIKEIDFSAWALHASVAQTYDHTLPYGYHLQMVADLCQRYAAAVLPNNDTAEDDVLPLIFAAFYHDAIEDARLTYHDVKLRAATFMNETQATLAAEMVYALTNEKGRTREERANDRYYAGIRATPYAPFLKLCDRIANLSHSCRGTNAANNHMKVVYVKEWPHFIASIREEKASNDSRFALPEEMLELVADIML